MDYTDAVDKVKENPFYSVAAVIFVVVAVAAAFQFTDVAEPEAEAYLVSYPGGAIIQYACVETPGEIENEETTVQDRFNSMAACEGSLSQIEDAEPLDGDAVA